MVTENKKDYIEDTECIKCKVELERRLMVIEKEICAIVKPEIGSFSRMNERINKDIGARPTWIVFWSIIGLMFALIVGSYGYTYNMSKDIHNMSKEIVTKQDLQSFKEDIERKLDRIEIRLRK